MKPEEIVVGGVYEGPSPWVRILEVRGFLPAPSIIERPGVVRVCEPGMPPDWPLHEMWSDDFARWATRRLDTQSSEGGAHG